ncbi:MAG: oligosaccharide flippase family protein [Bacteroidales bacterium]|nr:oligosaccharide flippase family protein [Bacteroidales bacterium]
MKDIKQSNTGKAIKGMSSQTIVTLVLGVAEVIGFSVMSRLLTKEDFGYYAAITAVTMIFQSFSETGIGSALIQKKNPDSHYVNNAFTLSLIVGLFLSLLLCVLSRPLSIAVVDTPKMTFPLILMSITILGHCLVSVNISIMYKRLEFLKVGLINLIAFMVSITVEILLALRGFGYYAIIARATLVTIVTLILSYFYAHTGFRLELDKQSFKDIFGFSGWLMASSVVRNLSQQVDKLMMTRLLSVEALGAYNRPKEFITKIAGKLNGIFDTALFPVLSDVQDNKQSLQNALSKSLYYLNIFGMVIGTSFIFNSELVIRIFFGQEWLSLKLLVQIFSFYLILNVDGRLMDCFIRSIGKTKAQFYFRVVQLLITVAGLAIGAQWGMHGVAVAVIAANFIMVIIKLFYVSSFIGFNRNDAIKTILSSWQFILILIPAYIATQLMLPNTIIGNCIQAGVYVILVGLLFFAFPIMVGKRYKNEIYYKMIDVVRKKIFK